MSDKDSFEQDRKVLPALAAGPPSDKNLEKKTLNGITSATFDLEELSISADVEKRLQQVEEVLLKLQQPLQCSICLDLLSNPVSTKCGHNFCTLCIHRLLQGVRGPSSCPLCLAPVTKRSLEKNERVSQLVLAVRGIIDGIKKDCGLINSPSKSRALAPPAVEDNSDEEEMDEPRRGTRNRLSVPECRGAGHLLRESVEDGTSLRGVKKGRGKRGTALVPARNVSARDLLPLDNNSDVDARRSSKPVVLKDSIQAMRRSAADLTVPQPDQPKPFETFCKPATGAPFPVGGRGRGRGRGGGRGRGRPANVGSSSTRSLGLSTTSSEAELVSVSQVREAKQDLPPSVDGAKNIHSNQKEIKEVESLKPKDKVSLWLNESSAVGFKIGVSQATDFKPLSAPSKSVNVDINDSLAKSMSKDISMSKEKAADLVIPSGGESKSLFALPVLQNCDKEVNGQFSGQSAEKSDTSARASSIVGPVDGIFRVPVDENKPGSTGYSELTDDDELPDINETSKLDEFAESTPRESSKDRAVEGLTLDVSAISVDRDVDLRAEDLNVLPDSCPVNTKDLFDVLVETARKLPPPPIVEVDAEKEGTTADDVYFFCTPAEGNVQDVTSEELNVVKSKGSKKRTLECTDEQNDPIKKSKAPVQSVVGKNSTRESISSSVEKREDSKAPTAMVATVNKKPKPNKTPASVIGKGKSKSLKSSTASVNLLAIQSNEGTETASLVASCEAMPPPAAPDSAGQPRDRKSRPARTGGRGAANASKSTNTRYASELKKQLREPPKLMAMSLCVKDFKSPGWSHVAGAKKDLKSRHIGLNITGGDIKQDLSRLDRFAEPDKTMLDHSVKQNAGNDLRLVSSGESSVDIDDQTQKFDVENLDAAPEELSKISKLKLLVHQMSRENSLDNSDCKEEKSVAQLKSSNTSEKEKVQDNLDVLEGKPNLISVTVVPETQSDSTKSSCEPEKLLSTDAETRLRESPTTGTLATSSSSKGPFVRQSVFREPVKPKVTANKSKTKLIPYSSSENSSTCIAVPKVQLISDSSSLQANMDGESREAVLAADCSKQAKNNNEGCNVTIAVKIKENVKEVIHDGSSDALKASSTDILPENHTGNGSPVRRVMRSGRLRRDFPSSVSSSSVHDNPSKVRAKQPKTKPDLGSGEEKENVDVEGLPRSLKTMQKRSKSSADLSVTTTTYSTAAERAKLRSSLRSANLHVASAVPHLPKRATPAIETTVQDTSIAVLDAMAGEIMQTNAEEISMAGQNLESSIKDVSSLKNTDSDVKKHGPVSANLSKAGPSSMVQPGTQTSCTTGYCLTEATKFSSLETSSESVSSDLPAQSVEIRVGPKYSAPNQADAVSDPVVIPCFCKIDLLSYRKKISSEDSQGLEFEERTIIPTVFKNKRTQAELLTLRCDAATQVSNSGVELASVGVQCELSAEQVKHFNVQTEVLGTEVAVQVQLAPEGSHVAGVIPFGAVGDTCSDRCIGPLELLRKAAGEQKQCLHAVPCALYQTLISMLHLVPAQPLACCGHKTRIDETSKAGSSSNAVSDSKAANVFSDPVQGVTEESNHLPSSNSLDARSIVPSASENAPIHLAGGSQYVSTQTNPVADLDAASGVKRVTARKRGRRKRGHNGTHTEKPSKAIKIKDKGDIVSMGNNGSSKGNFESSALPPALGDLKTYDAASDLNVPASTDEAVSSSAGNTLSDTLLVDANLEAKNARTFKEHLMQKMNASQSQMSAEIPFLGGVNLQPKVFLEDCTSIARHASPQSKCSSMISAELPMTKNDKLIIPLDDSDPFKSITASRVTRQRSRVNEKPTSQSDLFASCDAQLSAKDTLAQEKSSVLSEPSISKLTVSTRKAMNDVKSNFKLSGEDQKRTVSSDGDNTSKTKKDFKFRSPVPSTGIERKISDSNLCKKIESRKFKRIRSFDDSDSSSDEAPSRKKPVLDKNKITTVVFGQSGPYESQENVSAHEKNSEELRLEKFDDGVLKYFGYVNEDVLDTALKNTECEMVSCKENIPNLPDINMSSELLGKERKTEMEKTEKNYEANLESGDEEDCIPGTAEVLKNIAVDAALIQKVRDQKKGHCSSRVPSELISQETVVLSSSIESCADVLQDDILPSSIPLHDVHDPAPLRNERTKNSDGLERKISAGRDHSCMAGSAEGDTCPSGASEAGLTGTARQLFTACDRSLRRVERALRSQDTSVASSDLNTGSEKPLSKMTTNSSTTDVSDGLEYLLGSAGASGERKFKDDRSSTSTISSGPEGFDKGDDTAEDLAHLSMTSTQSEIISTQYRNKVQSEVEILQAKMAALQQQLSSLKQGPQKDDAQISDKDNRIASEKAGQAPSNGEEKNSGDGSILKHDRSAANVDKLAPHLATGEMTSSAKAYSDTSSSSRSSAQPPASELASVSGSSGSRTTRASASKLGGQSGRKVGVNNRAGETATSHVPPTNTGREADDQDLFPSLPDLECDTVPKSEVPEKKGSSCTVVKKNESESSGAFGSVRKRAALVCTGLSAVETLSVYKLIKSLFRSPDACPSADTPVGELLKVWAPGVTHVIVKCGEDRTTERTLKYLFGVASGCWVVSFEWARRCLREGRLLHEGEFEALDSTGYPGPERGRRLRGQLLGGCVVCCAPPFKDVSRHQLHELVQLCGGQVVEEAALLQTHKTPAGGESSSRHQLQLIIIHTDEDDDLSKKRALDLSEQHGRAVVASDWLIECVAMYSLVALSPYLLSPPYDHILRASGITLELLQETQEFV